MCQACCDAGAAVARHVKLISGVAEDAAGIVRLDIVEHKAVLAAVRTIPVQFRTDLIRRPNSGEHSGVIGVADDEPRRFRPGRGVEPLHPARAQILVIEPAHIGARKPGQQRDATVEGDKQTAPVPKLLAEVCPAPIAKDESMRPLRAVQHTPPKRPDKPAMPRRNSAPAPPEVDHR